MKFVQDGLQYQRHLLHHRIRGIDRIEVEYHKVWPLYELYARTPWILGNGAHVGDVEQLVPVRPDEITDVTLHVRGPDFLRADPVRRVVMRILLIEMFAVDAIGIAIEDKRTIEKMRDQYGSDAIVEPDEIAFGEAILRPVELLLMVIGM